MIMHYFKNHKTYFIIGLALLVATSLHMNFFGLPCFNSDEASFAYNAFSVLKTGKDEYGNLLPLRFLAFGENKLPMIIYGMIPSLALFGRNEFAARLPFILLGVLSPILFYQLAKHIFQQKSTALLCALLASASPWIQTITRHVHEAPVVMYLQSGILIFAAVAIKELKTRHVIYISLLNGISLFTYHSSKVLFVYNLFLTLFLIFQKNKTLLSKKSVYYLCIFLTPVLIFASTELMQPNNRVSTLAFFQNKGFVLRIEDLRKEHPNRLVHNKLTESYHILSRQYLSYFSPEFLVFQGDANTRFGFTGISPVTVVEYLAMIAGIVLLFVKKNPYRWHLIGLLLITPVSAALTWQQHSLTRSFVMIVPLLLLASYGITETIRNIGMLPLRVLMLCTIGGLYCFSVFSSWETYFYHYLQKPETAMAWQCGYKQVIAEIEPDIKASNTIYFTRKLGQPYIFTLFYTQYPPDQYQSQAHLTEPDEYGFGQVEKYDNITFSFQKPDGREKATYIGYPEEFEGSGINKEMVKKISSNGNDIFWIYRQ